MARKGGRGVHKVARVTGKTLDAGYQGAKKLDTKYGITNKTASAAVGAVSAIKKGVEFVSEKITGKEVKKPSQKEDEKDFVQNTTTSKTPDEQTLLSPFERGVEPEFAYVFNFFSLSVFSTSSLTTFFSNKFLNAFASSKREISDII